MNLKRSFLNRLADPMFARIGAFLPKAVRRDLGAYSHILVESGPSPLLTPVLRRHAPKAQIVYHAADRLSTIGVPPPPSACSWTISDFTTGSIFSRRRWPWIFRRMRRFSYLPHGIDKAAFDAATENPYRDGRYGPGKHAVSVGDMLF